MITFKGYANGTDRLIPPAETVERVRPYLSTFGITRIANITGLDHTGIPVVIAVRPNSRGMATSQGKGLTLDAAKASAIMESIEFWHAENISAPLHLATVNEMRRHGKVVDLSQTALARRDFPSGFSFLWMKGMEIVSREDIWVPYDLVHADRRSAYSRLPERDLFALNSNGLASGNHLLEATSYALNEVIERDSIERWRQVPNGQKIATRLDLTTVDDFDCLTVLAKLADANIAVLVHDITSEVGVPAFSCTIGENPNCSPLPLYSAHGSGCHPRREIALLRAITEAAQGRTTMISGVRDVIYRSDYNYLRSRKTLERNWRVMNRPVENGRDFRNVPTHNNSSFDEDVQMQLEKLVSVGVTDVAIVDLTRTDLKAPVAVVRAVVPGMLYH